MSTCFPRLPHMFKKVIFPVPTTCETNPESICGFYDWLTWPSGTKTDITSSRKFWSTSRKLGWKLDFRGFKSIGSRTHSSIGAERYGPRNIDDLHWDGLPLRYRCESQSGSAAVYTVFAPLACRCVEIDSGLSWWLMAICIKVPQIYQNHLFSLKYFKHIIWIQ